MFCAVQQNSKIFAADAELLADLVGGPDSCRELLNGANAKRRAKVEPSYDIECILPQ